MKLQTSSTIDLGAISPDSNEHLDFPAIGRIRVNHQDVRYAVLCGSMDEERVTLTGMDLYSTFDKFGGLVIDNKCQLPLPKDFFDWNTEGIFD